jgi:hypothetical protein
LLQTIAKAQEVKDPVLKQPDRVRVLACRTDEAKKLEEKELSQSIFGSDIDNKRANEKERLKERQEKKDREW